MSEKKLVAGLGRVNENWGSALRESGLRFENFDSGDEALRNTPDFLLVDVSREDWKEVLQKIRDRSNAPVISLFGRSPHKKELMELRQLGVLDHLLTDVPTEEMIWRIQSMLQPKEKNLDGESRSSKRIWFQQKVKFQIFEKTYEAWSTTLSETGIFLRTSLSFPLYSVLHLNFELWGENEDFECDGVIVRQEVDAEPRGLGVMFQNLKGDNIRRLEAFFDLLR